MIQRIQSLYLLCAIIFMAIFAFTPYFNIVTPDATYQLTSCGIEATQVADTGAAVVVASQNYFVVQRPYQTDTRVQDKHFVLHHSIHCVGHYCIHELYRPARR